jgi:ATP synthase protein I
MAEKKRKEKGPSLSEQVRAKERRKIRARREEDRGIWFGLGMFGMVGWAVAIPSLLGVALGIWIDRTYPGPHSWTLMGLLLGVVVGCLNAWFWVNRESKGK